MLDVVLNILLIIGAGVAILGAAFFTMFGFMILYELIGDEYDNFKYKLEKKRLSRDRENLAMHHLEKLKKRYPDLEISYTKK